MSEIPKKHSNISAFFADQEIGLDIVRHVLMVHPHHVKCVVTIGENEIAKLVRSLGYQVFHYDEVSDKSANEILGGVEFIFLAWWPRIIPAYLINTPKVGVVNFHPSLLPYNRGKHYNFWTIVEDTPFGVTLHFVDEGIDSGDILFQSAIEKSWEDTGGSLYSKATKAMAKLFKDRYLDIVEGRYRRTRQDIELGKLHYARELDRASQIFLEEKYSARELLNLLRARTFEGKPACYFWDDGKKYEVRVSIKEVDSERY